jgi:hypothetical protein
MTTAALVRQDDLVRRDGYHPAMSQYVKKNVMGPTSPMKMSEKVNPPPSATRGRSTRGAVLAAVG